jgi:hypothetical protein
LSVKVVIWFCGAAGTPLPAGNGVVGTIVTVVLSADATICPHPGPDAPARTNYGQ